MGQVTVSLENSMGGVSGCQRHPWQRGGPCWKSGGVILQAVLALHLCFSRGCLCSEVPVSLRGSLRSVLPALPWPHVQHLSQIVHLGVQV